MHWVSDITECSPKMVPLTFTFSLLTSNSLDKLFESGNKQFQIVNGKIPRAKLIWPSILS